MAVEKKRKSAPEAGVAGVQIDADANALVQTWCDKTGRIKREVLSKLSRWFMGQPVSFRGIILDDYPPELVDAYAAALEGLAASLRAQTKKASADSAYASEDNLRTAIYSTTPGPTQPAPEPSSKPRPRR